VSNTTWGKPGQFQVPKMRKLVAFSFLIMKEKIRDGMLKELNLEGTES